MRRTWLKRLFEYLSRINLSSVIKVVLQMIQCDGELREVVFTPVRDVVVREELFIN